MAGFELVKLIDGHHVHGAKAIDLPAEVRDVLFRRCGCRHRRFRSRLCGFLGVVCVVFDLADGNNVGRLGVFDLRHHVVERHLQRFDARFGEMRQMAFGCRPRYFELGHLLVRRLEAFARIANRGFVPIGLLTKIVDSVLGHADVGAQGFKPCTVAIEQ